MSTVRERDPAVASEDERAALGEIAQMLASGTGGEPPALVGASGERVPLPESLLHVLRPLVHDLMQHRPVTVLALSRELTPQQAADILNVSRPFLVKQLLDTGQIPFSMVGTHRRIAYDDLMAYRQRRDEERRRTLRELSRLSQQLGLE